MALAMVAGLFILLAISLKEINSFETSWPNFSANCCCRLGKMP